MSVPLVFLVAAERSGDLLGAGLARELKALTAGDVRLSGIGGSAMAEQGIVSATSIEGLNILGWIDGLKAYKRVKQAVSEAVEAILKSKPDVVVLIDSWGFTLRVARGVRAARAPTGAAGPFAPADRLRGARRSCTCRQVCRSPG